MEHKMEAALKTADGAFETVQVDMPTPLRPDWVLVRIRVAGICGTDLRHWKKENPDLVHKIMGHELAGEVQEAGSEVKHLKVGDRVVVETLLGDETCDWCRIEQYNLCPHLYEVRMKTVSQAFAQYLAAPAKKCHKLPAHVSYEEATLLDTFSVGLHAIQLSGIKANDKVVVIGAGPIGMGQLQLARISGADVLVTDVVDSALELAKELGADAVVNTSREDGLKKVLEFTDGRGADIVFECAGGPSMPDTLPQATTFARIGGKVVIVGGFDPGEIAIPLNWERIQKQEIKLIPSASYSFWGLYPEMQICLELLAKGKLNARKLITHSFPLAEINQAFETAQDKEHTKAVFVALTM
ncbi:alcohol dehydrogenase catalytic domain-containing protein [uncultured Chitinophaga sp.]|jgi:Threonine dehydrogenase and related Zn-dependent dehydrogenases|uniref:zinc-dependent alcohol dehydrogenase n=1 Tax=uncultured Chitinophaga sp. TaxID=339340 RepID=UPI00260D3115|nr:alcohol dehydrogenase catalytic domain-containing protein [uncultured Chitinophaga sp.]